MGAHAPRTLTLAYAPVYNPSDEPTPSVGVKREEESFEQL